METKAKELLRYGVIMSDNEDGLVRTYIIAYNGYRWKLRKVKGEVTFCKPIKRIW